MDRPTKNDDQGLLTDEEYRILSEADEKMKNMKTTMQDDREFAARAKSMKTVFLIGPYSGDSEQNVARAMLCASVLRKKGYAVVSPHQESFMVEGSLDREGWILHSMALMLKCDAISIFGDVKSSKGSARLIGEALVNHIPMVERFE